MVPWRSSANLPRSSFSTGVTISSWWRICSTRRAKTLKIWINWKGKTRSTSYRIRIRISGTASALSWLTAGSTIRSAVRWTGSSAFYTRAISTCRRRYMWLTYWSSWEFWRTSHDAALKVKSGKRHLKSMAYSHSCRRSRREKFSSDNRHARFQPWSLKRSTRM